MANPYGLSIVPDQGTVNADGSVIWTGGKCTLKWKINDTSRYFFNLFVNNSLETDMFLTSQNALSVNGETSFSLRVEPDLADGASMNYYIRSQKVLAGSGAWQNGAYIKFPAITRSGSNTYNYHPNPSKPTSVIVTPKKSWENEAGQLVVTADPAGIRIKPVFGTFGVSGAIIYCAYWHMIYRGVYGKSVSGDITSSITIHSSVNPELDRGKTFNVSAVVFDILGKVSDRTYFPKTFLRNMLPNPPTNLFVSAANDSASSDTVVTASGIINLSWDAAVMTTCPPVSYLLSSRVKKSGSEEWSAWSTEIDTGNVTSYQTEPALDSGDKIEYRIRTKDYLDECSEYVTFVEVERVVKPESVTSLSVTPTLWESGNITLTWDHDSEAQVPADHYELEISLQGANGVYGEYLVVDSNVPAPANSSTATYTVTNALSFNPIRGKKFKFRVRSVGAYGTSSEWAESPEVKRNSLPTAPGVLNVPLSVWTGRFCTLTWTDSTDDDGNIAYYEIEFTNHPTANSVWTRFNVRIPYGNSGQNVHVVGAEPPLAHEYQEGYTATSYTYDTLAANHLRNPDDVYQYRIRAVDALGGASEYTYSRGMRGAPNLVNDPSARIYIDMVIPKPKELDSIPLNIAESVTPPFKLRIDKDTYEGQPAWCRFSLTYNGRSYYPVGWDRGYKKVSSVTNTLFRVDLGLRDVDFGDNEYVTVNISMNTQIGRISASLAPAYTLKVYKPGWKRRISTGTVISDNEGKKHTEDIEEMRDKLAMKADYLGLTASWIDGYEYFRNWKSTMTEIAQKAAECLVVVEQSPPTVTIPDNYPRASVVNAIRGMIEGI